MVRNWNLCLSNSQGEYVQFLCADDYFAENSLEKKVKVFNINQGICLVFNSTYIVDSSEKIVLKRRPFRSDKLFDGKAFAYKSFIRYNFFGEPSNVMFKKEISKKVGCFDDRLCYAIDWDYWIKLGLMGKVYYLDDFLTYFRLSNTSETSNLFKTKEKLQQDDEQLIKNCLENKDLKLNKADILLHKFNINFRMHEREILYKLYGH